MKKLTLLLALLLIGSSGALRAQEALTTYLETAAQNNLALQVKFNDYLSTLNEIPQVGTLPDPQVAFGYFIQPIETRLGPQQAKISVSQMFPWFGTLSSQKNSASSLAKSKYELFEDAKSKLFYDVKATYYNLYFTQQAIEITLDNLEILSSFQNIANIKVESGLTSAVDAYRIEIEINDLENQLALLKDNLNVITVQFNTLLNVDKYRAIDIPDQLNGKDLISKQTELDSILVNNNALASFDYQLEGLEFSKQSAHKDGLPQFGVGFEYAFIGQGTSTDSRAGKDAFVFPTIGLSIPLYRSKYKSKVQEVVFAQESKGFEKDDKINTLNLLFESTWKDYSDAVRRVALYEQQSKLARKSLTLLESQYATNNSNFEEILRMERKLLSYALELQKATTDKEASVAFMEYLQGK